MLLPLSVLHHKRAIIVTCKITSCPRNIADMQNERDNQDKYGDSGMVNKKPEDSLVNWSLEHTTVEDSE